MRSIMGTCHAARSCLVIGMVVVAGCDLLSKDRVPDAEEVRRFHSAFLVEETGIRGVYGNMDVDSVVFTYQTNAADETTFWDKLHEQVEARDWRLVDDQDSFRRYERIIPRTGQQGYHSAEEARIAYKAPPEPVVVAWVEADTSTLPDTFADTDEAQWANGAIWPKFQELVDGKKREGSLGRGGFSSSPPLMQSSIDHLLQAVSALEIDLENNPVREIENMA
jgi:hypothetical protein